MKKVVLLFLVVLLVMPSCKFIKTKIFSKNVDTLSPVIDTFSQSERMEDSLIMHDMGTVEQSEPQAPVISAPTQPIPATNAQYYMIVGCFTVPENASKYAEKIRGMGFEGEVIDGPGNFQMVTARSYNSFRSSIADIDQLRSEITPNAWVYVRK